MPGRTSSSARSPAPPAPAATGSGPASRHHLLGDAVRLSMMPRRRRRAVACAAALGLLVGIAPAARAQGTLSALETDVDLILATTRPSVVSVVTVRDAPE